MAIPKDPRQQMINIMYLVLIALLALNVSNEIVNAFKTLKKGIGASSESIDKKVDGSFKQFQAAVEKNPDGQKYLDKATLMNQYSEEFIAKIEALQLEINEGSNRGKELDADGLAQKLDDQDTPTRILVKEGRGKELEATILDSRAKFLALFDDPGMEADKAAFEQALLLNVDEVPADNKAKTDDWATFKFNQMPLIGAVTLLEQFKNDAKNSAATGIDILKNNVSKEEILYDAFDVAIVPSASKLIQGEKFTAEVFLTASSSASKPRISINGKGFAADAGGRAKYETTANSLGKKSITANLSYKDGFGKDKTLTKKFEYEVVPPPDHVPVVSATKMNAFYIGLDNPVSASITGVRENKTNVSCSGCDMSKAGTGNYIARVSAPGEVQVNLSGTNEQGKKLTYSVPFRAKRIPDPVPKIGKQSGGKMASGEFKAQQGLRADLEDFLFDAKFQVKGYELIVSEPGQDLQSAVNSGAKFGDRCSRLIAKAKPGTVYYFDDIRAVGPDGKTRKLPSIAFQIK